MDNSSEWYFNLVSNSVSRHAAERFVERVLGFDKSMLKTKRRICKVKEEIYLQTKHYLGVSGKIKVRLPDYDKFVAVIENGKVLTIMEK